MKGIAHFLSGIAVASCVPGVVGLAAQGSWLLVLAGACALLPDTLDFKLARFCERADVVCDATGGAQALAERLAEAARVAAEGRPQVVRLCSMPCGFDRWRQYSVRLDVPGQAVRVYVGPVVSGGQTPVPGTAEAADEAHVTLPLPLEYAYDTTLVVDVFAGPSLRFARVGTRLRIEFLPWHRAQTHSLVLAALCGVLAGLAWGPLAGWVAALAYATHVVEDQLGALGAALWWPLVRRRAPGWGWLRAGDPAPNVITVWLALSVLVFNLWRAVPAADAALAALLMPAGVLALVFPGALGVWYARTRRATRAALAVEAGREARDETT